MAGGKTARRIRLIHWNGAEAREAAARLKAAGMEVQHSLPWRMEDLRALGEDLPAAVVIDLSRLPSQGRDVALAIRQRKATRHLPLVFLEGEAAKVARLRTILPDAIYSSWKEAETAIRRAIHSPRGDPVVPDSILAGYSGTPLPKKLGIKPGSVVNVMGAPEEFRQILGELPEGAQLRENTAGEADLILWFIGSRKELARGIQRMAARVGAGSVWMIWPKKSSEMATDLTQQVVRETGLATGLVDYKICAVDATWSGLLFTRRKAKRKG